MPTNRVLVEHRKHRVHGLTEINVDRGLQGDIYFVSKARRILVEFFEENTVSGNFTFDVAVCRAGHANANWTAGTVTRQAHHANVMRQIFTAELRANTAFLCNL